MSKSVSIEILHKLLICNAEAGTLTWRERPREFFKSDREWKRWNGRYAGKPALASLDKSGYLQGRIFKSKFQASRVIWAMTNGEWPKGQVDHERGDLVDNRPVKMRDVSNLENSRNAKLARNNSSGVTGVSWSKARRLWTAYIYVSATRIFLGAFASKADAVTIRKAAEVEHGFHPNHGRRQC